MKRKKGERIKGISGCDEMKGYEYLLPSAKRIDYYYYKSFFCYT
ncbi:hypothetical protein M2306_000868 [Myroides gitamensis]|uniref:Uncharacterized protein n=1 Tax=Myroides odoratus TaxID=256 RepID=A0A378RPN9_MYROD|nr:hypothetical protein [Myroides odoratus]MDH6600174.1 hypothetical protein [Myroides gitamensis]STZ27610.1 Uncharacterised protein [Myroides odoratus]